MLRWLPAIARACSSNTNCCTLSPLPSRTYGGNFPWNFVKKTTVLGWDEMKSGSHIPLGKKKSNPSYESCSDSYIEFAFFLDRVVLPLCLFPLFKKNQSRCDLSSFSDGGSISFTAEFFYYYTQTREHHTHKPANTPLNTRPNGQNHNIFLSLTYFLLKSHMYVIFMDIRS